jgi:hypothetical protein
MTDALSPKQLDYLRNSTATVNVCDGSIRSGKTIITLFRWLLFVRRAPRGGELVMVGRTRDSIWRNLVAPMQDPELFGAVADAVVGNYGAPTVSILGRKIHLIGASDAKAEKVIRGMTVAGAYVDEITVTSEEFFTQLLGRMSVKGAKLFGSTNPDNPAHWFKTSSPASGSAASSKANGLPLRVPCSPCGTPRSMSSRGSSYRTSAGSCVWGLTMGRTTRPRPCCWASAGSWMTRATLKRSAST